MIHNRLQIMRPQWAKTLAVSAMMCGLSCSPRPEVPERVTTLACYDGQPCMSADGRTIVMVSTQSGERHLWIYDVEAKTREPLTANEGADERPAFSPDGMTIAFSSMIEGQRDIWLIDQEERLTNMTGTDGADEFSPCWTSDGAGIVFVRRDSSGHSVCRMDARNAGQWKVLWSDTARLDVPTLSGSQLFFQRWDGGRWSIVQANDQGGPIRAFGHGSAQTHHPSLSPDGRHVAFVSDMTGHDEVYVSPVSRYDPAPVTRSATSHAYPAWTSDGKGLLWEETSNWDIGIIDEESQEDSVVVRHPANDRHPVVTSDGRRIVFTSDRDGRDQLFVLDLANGSIYPLTGGEFIHRDADIAGDRIVFTSNRGGNLNLFDARLVAGDSGLVLNTIRQLTHDPVAATQGRWMRNGRGVVFVSQRKGKADIWLLREGDGEEKPLTVDERYESDPSTTLDDAAVLFAANWAGRWSLWSAPIAGGLPLPMTRDKTPYAWDREPVLSPDGRLVIFTRSWYDDADVWLMRVDGGERSTRTLTKDNTGQESGGRWFPDGKRVVFQTGHNTDVWIADISHLLGR